jgi:hypothetical protein
MAQTYFRLETVKIKNPTSGNTGQKWGTLKIIF